MILLGIIAFLMLFLNKDDRHDFYDTMSETEDSSSEDEMI